MPTPIRPLVAVLVACLFAPPPSRGGPADDLLRLVPDDYTLCVVLNGLRDKWKAADADNALARFALTPAYRSVVADPELKKAITAATQLLKDLDISAESLRDDILGDAAVFSFRDAGEGNGDKSERLLLVQARDGKLLAGLIDKINAGQKKSGELKDVEAVAADGVKYFQRRKAGGEDEFYALHDGTLLFSNVEAAVKNALATHARPPKPGDVPKWVERTAKLGLDKALLAFVLNPRAFDKSVEAGAGFGGAEGAFLGEFGKYWKTAEGAGLYLDIAAGLEVGLVVRVDKEKLPEPARRFMAAAGKPSALWSVVPDDAILAVAGRTDAAALVEMAGPFLTDADRKAVRESAATWSNKFFGKGKLDAVLAGLGPDWGAWIAPPAAGDKTWVPRMTAAVKVAPGKAGEAASEAALTALDRLALLASFGDKELTYDKSKIDGVEVKHLAHEKWPTALRPAFAAKDGYVVAAESPEGVRRFAAPVGEPKVGDDVPLLRFSAAAARKYLKAHGDGLAEGAASFSGRKVEAVRSGLGELGDALTAFDAVEIAATPGPGRVAIRVRLTGPK